MSDKADKLFEILSPLIEADVHYHLREGMARSELFAERIFKGKRGKELDEAVDRYRKEAKAALEEATEMLEDAGLLKGAKLRS